MDVLLRFPDTSCTVLEQSFGCNCDGCRCMLDSQRDAAPAPAPEMEDHLNPGDVHDKPPVLSTQCTADCVSTGTSCDYWEFNTCSFLETSKGCDCSGCACA
jgi:hypothetical protein